MDLIPNKLDNFIINNKLANTLRNLNINNISNIIFYGKNNSGKKTLVDALLNNIFDTDIVSQKKLCSAELKIGNNKVEIDYLSSPFHFEINLYEYGLYDADIVTDFIYERLKYKSLSKYPFRLLVVNHFDRITYHAQQRLMRIMDKCYKTARIILTCEDISKIITSFTSRCSSIRVPLPNKQDLKDYLEHISKNTHKFSTSQQNRILSSCNNNIYLLNQIIYATIANPKFNFLKIDNINKDITKIYKLIETPNLISILEIRSICYNLLLLNFSMNELFSNIVNSYIPKMNGKYKIEFVQYAANINQDMINIEHDIISIEFLILKVKKLLLLNK